MSKARKQSPSDPLGEMAQSVIESLSGEPKTLSSRWLYDKRGSELFEEITQLPEYYPTRTETAIFQEHAQSMAEAIGPDAVLVEYGAGALVKTRILLDALERPQAYAPIDISGPFLAEASARLSGDFPQLEIIPIVGDFTRPLDLSALPGDPERRIGFFPGSTIGNLTDAQIQGFFTAARESLGPRAHFLLGADMKKDPGVLVPAYDDAAGVTAQFNLNLLTRLNRDLDTGFELDAFHHEARWNEAESRIEMHLVAGRRTQAQIDGFVFELETGESIRSEISRKFTLDALDTLLGKAGWKRDTLWQDEKRWFSVLLLS